MEGKIKIDAKDKNLVKELEKDARASFSQIAKKIGVSREIAHYRLKKLTENKIIRKITPIINNYLLGIKAYSLIIDLQNLKKDLKEKIMEEIKNAENIEGKLFLQSDSDIEITIYPETGEDFYSFYNRLTEKYSEYIHRKEISIITKRHILGNRYLYGQKRKVIVDRAKDKIKIDKSDYDILKLISKNPREKITNIAQEIGLGERSVVARIKKLRTNGIIAGYFVSLDGSSVGYQFYKVKIILSRMSEKEKIISFLELKPETMLINEIIGTMDLEFEIASKNTQGFESFLGELSSKFPTIRDFKTMAIL